LGNNITPLREEEWGEDEEDENDIPAPSSPPTSPINTRCIIFSYLSLDLLINFSLQAEFNKLDLQIGHW